MRVMITILILLMAGTIFAQQFAPEPGEVTGFHGADFGMSEKVAKKAAGIHWDCHDGSVRGLRACDAGDLMLGEKRIAATFTFLDGKFCCVRLKFNSADYAYFRTAFVTKYGDPTHQTVETRQNNLGASFQGEKLSWEGPTTRIELSQLADRVTQGSAVLGVKAAIDAIIDQLNNKAQNAVDQLQ